MAQLYIGDNPYEKNTANVNGKYVNINGEQFYCIENYDQMPPFFMNVVSNSDHWMFISSTGGLSAGRQNAESALFPYYTVDKLTENAGNTGHVAALHVHKDSKSYLWEPFSAAYPGAYKLQRNLYKNIYGNTLIFEEVNTDLGLTYQYRWQTSDKFGFVKTCLLMNFGAKSTTVEIIDGLQNLLPYGATTALQTTFSNLLNGYKRNELETGTGLAMFSLSSTLTDLAEPSESLKTTTVWHVGLPDPKYLLSAKQLADFREGKSITQETDIRARRGAYLVNAKLKLDAGAKQVWLIVAEVNQDSADVIARVNALKASPQGQVQQLFDDINACTAELVALVANADGLQCTGDNLSANHHFANILFNIMRGGIFLDNHNVNADDLRGIVKVRNKPVLESHKAFFAALPENLTITELLDKASKTGSADLLRLCYEYLPLTFSRRHGDPSRPWNQFSINIHNVNGSRRLDYQGNWRDIFQNWEPLAVSYPEFIEGMISKFLNATTADGYNPYRVTAEGIEWEAPAPDDPWANIGYWSDHQIIYLQKLLELSTQMHPSKLETMLKDRIFSHSNVPYRIKPYDALLENPYDSIDFDDALHEEIMGYVDAMGTDSKLVLDADNKVLHVNLAEKLLILLLAKLANFVPGGGIWMNTQRPEWNDANNALVGKGLSVVTLCYLRRYIAFFRDMLAEGEVEEIELTQEVKAFLDGIFKALVDNQAILDADISKQQRRAVMDALGQAGSAYRGDYYKNGIGGDFATAKVADLVAFLDLAQRYAEQTIRLNEREDKLYHAYNVLQLEDDGASVRNLYEMLEGQVAILSSGLLSGKQALALLKALRHSRMYRANQHSYMLYPNRDIPGFLNKNTLAGEAVSDSALVKALVDAGDKTLIIKDENGNYHFNGTFRNANGVKDALAALKQDDTYAALVEAESDLMLELFEDVFDHDSFTGRSGTFFAYEGLGSIYWHMVSKLMLATQEVYFQALANGEDAATIKALGEAYYDIRSGIGFNKTPAIYGAFPTDPYSHTPSGEGAKQPGMTGQVKEECMTRLGEFGVAIAGGAITFDPVLLRSGEFLSEENTFAYLDVTGKQDTLMLPAGSLAFTLCQVPVVYRKAETPSIVVAYSDDTAVTINGNHLDPKTCAHIFQRDGKVKGLTVGVTNGFD